MYNSKGHFSLMSISEAQLTSSLSQCSPFFSWIMVSDCSLMIHLFDKNHLASPWETKQRLISFWIPGTHVKWKYITYGSLSSAVRGHSRGGISGAGVYASLVFHHMLRDSQFIAVFSELVFHLQRLHQKQKYNIHVKLLYLYSVRLNQLF